MIARRRRVAAQWDEYDPMPSLEESPYGEPKSSTGQQGHRRRRVGGGQRLGQAGKLADSAAREGPPGAAVGSTPPDNTFAPFAGPEESTKPSKPTPKDPKTP